MCILISVGFLAAYSRVPKISDALLLDFGEIFLHFTLIRKYIAINKKMGWKTLLFSNYTFIRNTTYNRSSRDRLLDKKLQI